ncbi:MAG: DUF4493 domain-containing protein [Bacteroidaceae bacterium]|nr:DUF4493 domain-containing protein [Bacteroidaceae bacterium]
MNKHILHTLLLLLALVITGCVSEIDAPSKGEGGRLQLSLGNISKTVTRSTPAQLDDPEAADFHLNLTTTNGYKAYDGVFTEEELSVPIGDYNITVSYGNNALLALDRPYYIGTATATVREDETTNVSVDCKVGNALISVNFGRDEDEHARFERFYSDYALYAYVGNYGMSINRSDASRSIYVKAGSHVVLKFWGKLKLEGDREVSCDLTSTDFPDVLNAADHAIVTLSLPDPESALGVDISKVEVETVTLDETIPLSWLPVPQATATHQYDAEGNLAGTNIVFSNSYPGMNWKAVVTNAAGTEVRSVEGTGELTSGYRTSSAWPYLPHGKYKATYYLVYDDGSSKVTSSREFMIGSPTLSITIGGYTNYDRYHAGNIDEANTLDGCTIYEPSIRWNVSESLLTNNKYTYTYSYTYDGTTTNMGAGSNSYTAEAWEKQTVQTAKHLLSATATFDGVTATDRHEYVITGLPYSLNLKSHDEWATSSGVDWYDNDVRLGHLSTGSQSITTSTSIAIPAGTYFCADYDVNVHTFTIGTTFSITVGNITILEIEEPDSPFNNHDNMHAGTTNSYKDDSQYFTTLTCHNSYGAGQTCSHIYSLTLKYGKK